MVAGLFESLPVYKSKRKRPPPVRDDLLLTPVFDFAEALQLSAI